MLARDAYASAQDARSEARYEPDPRAEPDTREVAEAMMRGGGAEPVVEDDRG